MLYKGMKNAASIPINDLPVSRHTRKLLLLIFTCVINFDFLLPVLEAHTYIIIMYLYENVYIIMSSYRHDVMLDMLRRGTL